MTQLKNEPKVVNENGAIQSDIGVDWKYLPWAGARAVAVCMSENAKEHGGSYPKDNWRGWGVDDHINHIVEHTFGAMSSLYPDDKLEHLVHLACRALMAVEAMQKELDATPLDW